MFSPLRIRTKHIFYQNNIVRSVGKNTPAYAWWSTKRGRGGFYENLETNNNAIDCSPSYWAVSRRLGMTPTQ